MSRPLSLLTWLLALAALATGLGQAWMRYLVEPVDEFSAYNHPWQGWTEALHVFLGPLLALVLGSVLAAHAAVHWRSPGASRAARRGGVVVVALVLTVALSGAWMGAWPQVGGLAEGRLVSWLHAVAGTVFVLALVGHARSAKGRP